MMVGRSRNLRCKKKDVKFVRRPVDNIGSRGDNTVFRPVHIQRAGGRKFQILGAAGTKCSAKEWNEEQIGVWEPERTSRSISMQGKISKLRRVRKVTAILKLMQCSIASQWSCWRWVCQLWVPGVGNKMTNCRCKHGHTTRVNTTEHLKFRCQSKYTNIKTVSDTINLLFQSVPVANDCLIFVWLQTKPTGILKLVKQSVTTLKALSMLSARTSTVSSAYFTVYDWCLWKQQWRWWSVRCTWWSAKDAAGCAETSSPKPVDYHAW